MGFKKGEKRPSNAGRKKGVPNKISGTVKEALAICYEGIGGQESLQSWARRNRTEFYKLWSKMLPTEIQVKSVGEMTLEELEKEAQQILANLKAQK